MSRLHLFLMQITALIYIVLLIGSLIILPLAFGALIARLSAGWKPPGPTGSTDAAHKGSKAGAKANREHFKAVMSFQGRRSL